MTLDLYPVCFRTLHLEYFTNTPPKACGYVANNGEVGPRERDVKQPHYCVHYTRTPNLSQTG